MRFLGKHSLDAAFGQFRSILKYVGKQRNVFVAEVDSRGTSQTCPNCRITVKKELKDRIHQCPECKYVIDRDVAAAQEICNRGIEAVRPCSPQLSGGEWRVARVRRKGTLTKTTYRGTPEKQEIVSQVLLSGNFVLDKWRKSANAELGRNAQ